MRLRAAAANGGPMYGCIDGHWVMGAAHNGTALPPTAVRPQQSVSHRPQLAPYRHVTSHLANQPCMALQVMSSNNLSAASLALTELIVSNTSITSAAECQALVRESYPQANAAQFGNMGMTGGGGCKAVFNACVPNLKCVVQAHYLNTVYCALDCSARA